MSAVDQDEIERIARLAALEVDPDALPTLADEIGRILEFVSQLSSIQSSPHEPVTVSDEAALLRPDEVRDASDDVDPSGNAPDYRDGLFVVPQLGPPDIE